jgi:diguanylate cyclase (GGDEF)-like protein
MRLRKAISPALGQVLRSLVERFLDLGGPATASGVEGRVRAAQIAAIKAYTPWMMAANIANALLIALSYSDNPYRLHVAAWASAVVALAIFTIWRHWRTLNHLMKATASRRSIRRSVTHAFLLGMLWAALPGFFAVGDMEQRVIVGCVVAGMLCGSGFALATVTPAAIAFAGSIALGSVLALILSPGYSTAVLFILNNIYIAIITTSSLALSRLLRSQIEDQIRSAEQRDYIGLLLSDFEEHGSDWIWMLDSEGRICHVSSRLTEMLRRPASELIGRSALRCLPVSRTPDARRQLANLVAAMKCRKAFRDLELSVDVEGWPQRWALTAKPIFTAQGQFDGYRGIGRNVTQASAIRKRNEYLARYDVLTGLANRASLVDHLTRACARLTRSGDAFFVFLLDLDNFKSINDTQGHSVGDELLVQVARRLEKLAGEHDLVARLGGDEFAMVVSDKTEAIAARADAILHALSVPYSLAHAGTVISSVSLGIAAASGDSDPDLLIRHADLALYRAKGAGRGTYSFFDPAMEIEARRRHQLEMDLRDALDTGALHLLYQPLVDTRTQDIVACEALARWHHPALGPISPIEFVPLAEERGLIDRLGAFVIMEACRQAETWPATVKVAINLSPIQFRSPGLFASIANALAQTGLAAHRLELEITESLFLESGDHVDATLDALRRLGVRICLDDFGVGYSSLSYLRRYHFDKIKIDRSFVEGLEADSKSSTIIAAIVQMAAGLNTCVAVEGVETAGQMARLTSLGCEQVQGFHVSRPVKAGELRLPQTTRASDEGRDQRKAG